MVKRDVKEAASTRGKFYTALEAGFSLPGFELLGMGSEGLVFKEVSTGLCTTLKAVTKAPEFDGEADVKEVFAKAVAKSAEKAKKDARKSGPVKVVKKAE